ncbi:hypothetical protein L248_2847 [Schleiferilactobacillus shenzhenensis LY-73]|uniref:Uncharacterized protein n=2 Tax=Schleiferilactobacillus shenzhenensis TaxID=1231337 RepID=U4TJZ9_9LACO|nr:hypothetical protein L248_2847 [Schleiferilactobacillus shenzhenensis LY-73]
MLFNQGGKQKDAWAMFAHLFDQEKNAFEQTGLIYHKLNYYMLIRVLAAVNTLDVPDVPTMVKESQAYFNSLKYFSTYDLIVLSTLMQWYKPDTTIDYLLKAMSGAAVDVSNQERNHWVWVLMANTLTFCNIHRRFDLGERVYSIAKQMQWPPTEAEARMLLYDAHMCARYGQGERGAVEAEMADFLASMSTLDSDFGEYLTHAWDVWTKSIREDERVPLARRAKEQIYGGDLSRIPAGFYFYYNIHPFDPVEYEQNAYGNSK